MVKTLFFKMLVTYLTVTLVLLVFLGVILGSMFRSHYIDEKENELRREAEEINNVICTKYIDAEKRSVAKDSLYTAVRKYDALLQLYFIDKSFGKVALMDEASAEKWEYLGNMDIDNIAKEVIENGNETRISQKNNTISDIPVLLLERPIITSDSDIIGAMLFYVDMSGMKASIRQVYMDVLLSAIIAVLLAFFAVSYITNKMTKPITDMSATVRRFSNGDFGARVKISGDNEVSQLGKNFNEMADEINAMEQSRRSFVANVSHELRSPLTSMRGFLEAIQDGTVPYEEQGKYLDVVIGECRRMTGMVNDLLDLARIESGTYELKVEPFDLCELAIRTLFTFEARINAKHIDVDMDFESDMLMVLGDMAQISQVVRNLADNAIKFSPDGGKLAVRIRTNNGLAVMSVQDEGEGINAEDKPYVFDRFYKAEKAHTPSGSSTGLGLSIVKRIVEQHGQNIWVDSEPGNGACFTFTLKLYEHQTKSRGAQRRENGIS